MGALTSKNYAYKSRPWEIQSIETISLQNSFFSKIKLEFRDKHILRILPVISVDEWIDDATRFFISVPKLKKNFLKLTHQKAYNFEGIKFECNENFYEKITFQKSLICLFTEITRNIVLIVDEKSDANVLRNIRFYDVLKQFFNITIINSTVRQAYINNITNNIFFNELLFEENELCIPKEIQKISQTLITQLVNTKYMSSTLESNLLINTRSLIHILEGRIIFSKKPLFVIPYALNCFIPQNFQRIILDVTNQAYSFGFTSTKPNFFNALNFHINLDSQNIWPINFNVMTLTSFIPTNLNTITINTLNPQITTGFYTNLFGLSSRTKTI